MIALKVQGQIYAFEETAKKIGFSSLSDQFAESEIILPQHK